MVIWLNASIMVYGHITEIIVEDKEDNLPSMPAGLGNSNVPAAILSARNGNNNGLNEKILYSVSRNAATENGVDAATNGNPTANSGTSNAWSAGIGSGTSSAASSSGSASNPMSTGKKCIIEVPIVKKYAGRCVNLSKTTRSCEYGTLTVPLHWECM